MQSAMTMSTIGLLSAVLYSVVRPAYLGLYRKKRVSCIPKRPTNLSLADVFSGSLPEVMSIIFKLHNLSD